MGKKLLLVLIILAAGLVVWQYKLIAYGLMQARGQMNVVLRAAPIDDFLQRSDFPDSLKSKLLLVQEIRQFSFDSLGINDCDNYTTLFDQKNKATLWNLTASEPFDLVEKTWTFPLLGSFPYKGFFNLEKAREEEKLLLAQGYDTRIREVGAWSTLGWFNDPILSNMLHRSEGQLAELIIHELTHGTLYIRDSIDYNENLATFIGQKGAAKFLTYRYGHDSDEYLNYLNEEQDLKKYTDHFIRGADALDSLYGSMSPDLDRGAKLKLKERMIHEIMQDMDTINFHKRQNYGQSFGHKLPNNAYFMAFQRYHARQHDFEKQYFTEFNSDIRAYLNYLKEKYPSL